jgi:sulfonate transport system permease protein
MNAFATQPLDITGEIPGAEPLAAVRRSTPSGGRRVSRLGLGEPLAFGPLLGPALVLLFWAAASYGGWLDPRILPSPWATAATAAALIADGRLGANLAVSAVRVAEGLTFGVAAGLVVAVASGLSRVGGYLIDGVVQMKRSIPTLALIPLVILWLGIGEGMKVTIIAFSAFVPIYIQTQAALRATDLRHLELAETLGLSRWQFLRSVVIPGALPGFMLGLRYAVLGSWLALVVVEQLNATSGIGYMINLARTYAQTDVIVVGLAVYAVLGLISDGLVRLADRLLIGWRRTLGR